MEPGEVITRGNIVMKEVRSLLPKVEYPFLRDMGQYFRDPKATAEAFRGGFFASGDIAIRYPDGSISIQDRSKDLIISGGEVRKMPICHANVSPLSPADTECLKFSYRARTVCAPGRPGSFGGGTSSREVG